MEESGVGSRKKNKRKRIKDGPAQASTPSPVCDRPNLPLLLFFSFPSFLLGSAQFTWFLFPSHGPACQTSSNLISPCAGHVTSTPPSSLSSSSSHEQFQPRKTRKNRGSTRSFLFSSYPCHGVSISPHSFHPLLLNQPSSMGRFQAITWGRLIDFSVAFNGGQEQSKRGRWLAD